MMRISYGFSLDDKTQYIGFIDDESKVWYAEYTSDGILATTRNARNNSDIIEFVMEYLDRLELKIKRHKLCF